MSLVEEYMNTRMVTRLSSANVVDLAKAMTDWKISSIAITDEGSKRVIGILTERDIVKTVANRVHPEKITASSLMSSPVFSIRKDQPIEKAARVMMENRVRHLLVEDAFHRVAGIITTTDLARYLKQRSQIVSSTKRQEQSSDFMSEVWELYF